MTSEQYKMRKECTQLLISYETSKFMTISTITHNLKYTEHE